HFRYTLGVEKNPHLKGPLHGLAQFLLKLLNILAELASAVIPMVRTSLARATVHTAGPTADASVVATALPTALALGLALLESEVHWSLSESRHGSPFVARDSFCCRGNDTRYDFETQPNSSTLAVIQVETPVFQIQFG